MKKDVPLCINFLTKKTPYKGLGADSEEKHEPASGVDTESVDSLKALDPERPIREADIAPPRELLLNPFQGNLLGREDASTGRAVFASPACLA